MCICQYWHPQLPKMSSKMLEYWILAKIQYPASLIYANKLDLHDLCLMILQTTCCVHASAVYNAAACILCQRLVTDTVQ